METRNFDHCFVCGSRNEAGLRLEIVSGNGEARAEFQPDARWEGYPGVVHGGVLGALLDDLMFHAIYSVIKQLAVTASIEVRFRRPARIGARLFCQARIGEPGARRAAPAPRGHPAAAPGPVGARVSGQGRFVDAEGEIRNQDGRLIATARSKYIIMSQAKMDDFMGNGDVL
ncbi:MAG: PaaI family thioesterase [Thermacetogeniaceae bacterium]|jgi:uncharacterized protein (TIGR00369 family)